jgi:putative ATP-binding cassette transporter
MNLFRLLRRAPLGSLAWSMFLCFVAPTFLVAAYLMGSGPLSFSRNFGAFATIGLAALALTINGLLQSRAIWYIGADFHSALGTVRSNIIRLLVTTEVPVVRAVGATEVAAVVEGDARLVAAVAPAVAVVTVFASWTITALMIAAHESLVVLFVYAGIFGLVYLVRAVSSNEQPAVQGDAAEARFRSVFDDLVAVPRAIVLDRKKAAALAEAAAIEATEAARQRSLSGARFARAVAASEALMLFAILAAHEISNGLVPGAAVSDSLMILLVATAGPFIRLVHSRYELEGADRAARRLLALEAGLRVAPRVPTMSEPLPDFAEVKLHGITAIRARRSDQSPFSLGPIELSIPRGTITVVSGENGSGKSTLLEVLLGYTRAQSGRLMVDGQPIDASSLTSYRQLFSVVFDHPHLFDQLYGHDESAGVAQEKMDWLGLPQIGARAPRTVTNALSTGQRKRVALARALAEDRPILVLDEYTADQDPSARERFATEILPALKAEGRTVIAVLHGSTIPACADYVARITNGLLVQETELKGPEVS